MSSASRIRHRYHRASTCRATLRIHRRLAPRRVALNKAIAPCRLSRLAADPSYSATLCGHHFVPHRQTFHAPPTGVPRPYLLHRVYLRSHPASSASLLCACPEAALPAPSDLQLPWHTSVRLPAGFPCTCPHLLPPLVSLPRVTTRLSCSHSLTSTHPRSPRCPLPATPPCPRLLPPTPRTHSPHLSCAPSLRFTACLSAHPCRTRAHPHTLRAHTHPRSRARTHTHTPAHACAHYVRRVTWWHWLPSAPVLSTTLSTMVRPPAIHTRRAGGWAFHTRGLRNAQQKTNDSLATPVPRCSVTSPSGVPEYVCVRSDCVLPTQIHTLGPPGPCHTASRHGCTPTLSSEPSIPHTPAPHARAGWSSSSNYTYTVRVPRTQLTITLVALSSRDKENKTRALDTSKLTLNLYMLHRGHSTTAGTPGRTKHRPPTATTHSTNAHGTVKLVQNNLAGFHACVHCVSDTPPIPSSLNMPGNPAHPPALGSTPGRAQ
eukprot:TRINITY_DN7579_c0_g1_i1.p1 TRINITY_DN7579_c0_g1~~TRINITY_DN7579_c0_g1_i1.p1  ORF type:complete len:488 (+),score=-124.79 TRINITY_DN7579_c0_g1_i1:352-1815(+)